MSDAAETIRALAVTAPLRRCLTPQLVAAFAPPRGSRGLDVGCGTGSQTCALADAVGPGGHVTGVDISEEVLARARTDAGVAGSAGRVDFVAGAMTALPFAAGSADWLWSSDCIGYPCGDPLPALAEALRVVRPGGRIAVAAWTSQQLLPGHAMLEARLNATCSAYAPYLEAAPGETQFTRLPRWFAEAGFAQVEARTLVGEVRAPLDGGMRAAVAAIFHMLWGVPQPGASAADVAAFTRLCRPESAAFICDLPGYYGFFTYTMVTGVVPGR